MILAILQARVSSTRLPGKVLKKILGVPMIFRQIERIQKSKLIDRLVVATSLDLSDNQIEELCKINQIECYRGSLTDVLDRFYQVGNMYKPEHVVRLTGDCPLIDPIVIDKVIQTHTEGKHDYTSNTIEPTYPDGLDVEIFSWPSLQRVWQDAKLPSQREHVTLYINQHPELFTICNVKNDVDLSHLRWTVDELADLILVQDIYEHLYPENPNFTTREILDYYKNNKTLLMQNNQYKRNEGLLKSLQQDKFNF